MTGQCGASSAIVSAMSRLAPDRTRGGGRAGCSAAGGSSPSMADMTAEAEAALESRLYPPSRATTIRPCARLSSSRVMCA
eukprot:scaffold5545_cov111-Isochrysis_galbana.AAC.5